MKRKPAIANLGVCTWVFGDTPLEEVVSDVAELGYDGIELFGDLGQYKPSDVRSCLRKYGASIFSVTPANVDLAHPDSDIRRQGYEYYTRLLDFAAEVEAPVIGCHGYVGRFKALSSQVKEEELLTERIHKLGERAEHLGVKIAVEVLNRYESHIINTAEQARCLINKIDCSSVGILLDTYHMNIEERDLCAAVETAGNSLFLFHVADSNRRGIGLGHIQFGAVADALHEIDYCEPIVVECTAPGPDPFNVQKGTGWKQQLLDELKRSRLQLGEII